MDLGRYLKTCKTMKLLYTCFRNIAKTIFCVCYGHKVYGLDHFFYGKAIIAPNHASFLDPPIIGISWPEEIAFLARKTLFANFILRPIITKLNALPVSGTQQDLSSIKLICHLLNEDKKVVIFPEGLRSSDGGLNEIKSGIGMISQRSHCPIIPAYIHGSYEIWNRERRYPKLWGKTACVFGSPIYPNKFLCLGKKEAQLEIANAVKNAIKSLKIWYENGAKGTPP